MAKTIIQTITFKIIAHDATRAYAGKGEYIHFDEYVVFENRAYGENVSMKGELMNQFMAEVKAAMNTYKGEALNNALFHLWGEYETIGHCRAQNGL